MMRRMMKMKKYILPLMFAALGITEAFAQTPVQAKALMEQGQYSEAKAAYEKLLKSQPANGQYNLQYGIACLRTAEPEKAVKYLRTAVKRRVTGAQLYLGEALSQNYQFEEAANTLETYIKELTRRRRDTAEAEKQLDLCRSQWRMLKGVEKVCVIDSVVVDKTKFLEAYRISPESGSLATYNDYFKESGQPQGVVFETELKNKLYFSRMDADSTLSIYTCNKLIDRWSDATTLPQNINGEADANYPYMLTDGCTLYYAANGAQSLGGYDIFVTRFNPNTNDYMVPQNVGMPFNSIYNDYMYVVDEFNNIGWFASDRYQPADKVCIYIFIPNTSKQVYNYEATDPALIVSLAQLRSIAQTQDNAEAEVVEQARKRLADIHVTQETDVKSYDFTFVVNSTTSYHALTDFQSAEARAAYQQYELEAQNYREQTKQLEALRARYAHAKGNEQKQQLAPSILDLENRVLTLQTKISEMAKKVRRIEAGQL